MLRRVLLLALLTAVAGAVVYAVVEWRRRPSMPELAGRTGVEVRPFGPFDGGVGLEACDQYVRRVCACRADRPHLPGSASRRCEVARLAATSWKARLVGPSFETEAVRKECERLLAHLSALEPGCAAKAPRPRR